MAEVQKMKEDSLQVQQENERMRLEIEAKRAHDEVLARELEIEKMKVELKIKTEDSAKALLQGEISASKDEIEAEKIRRY